jgi:Phytanoyl-CoA dioxygenase (PhyH)
MLFRLRRKERSDPETAEELHEEIERLTARNRRRRDRATERRLLRLRHLAGTQALDAPDGAGYAQPDEGALPAAGGLPEFAPADLTPGLVRAAILRDGCVLVRGLADREAALAFGRRIDAAFADREADRDGLYEEFTPHERFAPVGARGWIRAGGGLLAADSPALTFEMLELFRELNLAPLVDGYLGEPALISVNKTTLRKADPSVPGAWHQDGTFLGSVRSLNLWLSLSRCGDEAPGLDIVPRRIDHLVAAGTDDATIAIQTSRAKVAEAAGDTEIVRPIFEPGDAMLFDELFLHQTASDPAMPNPRYAIENWFFGRSAFPADYAPLAPW